MHVKASVIFILSIVVFLMLAETSPLFAEKPVPNPVSGKEVLQKIRREVLSKTPIPEILKYAERSGVKPGNAVSAIILSGGDSGIVIYFAIADGYPVKDVIRASVIEGIEVNAIVRSAINAGADSITVAKSIVGLGANPEDVADIIARESALPRLTPGSY